MSTSTLLGDPRFFERAGPFTLAELVQATGGSALRAEMLDGVTLRGVGPLQTAGPGEVAVLHNPKYATAAETTKASVVIVGEAHASRVAACAIALVVSDPHVAWAQAARLFYPLRVPKPAVDPSAVVHSTAHVDPSASIGPYAVIGRCAEIGPGCEIGPHAVIGDGVVLGPACRIGAHASLSHAILGARVYIYPGARIGQEGFGFAITPAGFISVPQLGRVILHDDVEIGANATIDRGASHDTIIGQGSRIDNLIQIGHNVQMGHHCVMAAQSGISGSCTLGDFVQIGAQAGLAGHLNVGSRARIGAQAGVMSDVAAASEIIGSPALPIREFFRNVAVLRRLARRGPASETRLQSEQAKGVD